MKISKNEKLSIKNKLLEDYRKYKTMHQLGGELKNNQDINVSKIYDNIIDTLNDVLKDHNVVDESLINKLLEHYNIMGTIENYIKDNLTSGTAGIIKTNDFEIVYESGCRDKESNKKMKSTTIIDYASFTKSFISRLCLKLSQIDETFTLDRTIGSFGEEFKDYKLKDVTIGELMKFYPMKHKDNIHIINVKNKKEVKESLENHVIHENIIVRYNDVPVMMIEEIIRSHFKSNVIDLLDKYILKPDNLESITIKPDINNPNLACSTNSIDYEIVNGSLKRCLDNIPKNEVQDPKGNKFYKMYSDLMSGAGLFGNIIDYATHLENYITEVNNLNLVNEYFTPTLIGYKNEIPERQFYNGFGYAPPAKMYIKEGMEIPVLSENVFYAPGNSYATSSHIGHRGFVSHSDTFKTATVAFVNNRTNMSRTTDVATSFNKLPYNKEDYMEEIEKERESLINEKKYTKALGSRSNELVDKSIKIAMSLQILSYLYKDKFVDDKIKVYIRQ